ncbi:TetR/AcrR family transcriptional regulator [Metabacillus iocasae]|uniref:AcrR family transcriptional regulator n=1 Tax=Priestia iocasae TaxID=2291674 RepID=A0ABS2QSJ4_9BACI|nr:TetR/AcrR family transcriptional regulator [Metabacillus iocasae]MBM7702404.1 AcrR family transcriptional regulator [Metabacillus iocasae]
MSTVENIKLAGRTLFGQKGYNGTSLTDIATEVGIKKPSLYAHFKNKDDLFLAVVMDLMTIFLAELEKSYNQHKQKKTKERLQAFLFDSCTFLQNEQFGPLYKRMILFPPEHLHEEVKNRFLSTEAYTNDALKELFQTGMENGEIRKLNIDALINSFYCLTDGLFIQRFYYDEKRYEQKINDAWTIFWDGIQA